MNQVYANNQNKEDRLVEICKQAKKNNQIKAVSKNIIKECGENAQCVGVKVKQNEIDSLSKYRVNFNLCGAILDSLDLRKKDLSGANLKFASLIDIKAQGVNLSDADLQHANLSGAELQEAKLKGINLQNADLSEAKLQEAELQGAELQGADLWLTNFTDANLEGAVLGKDKNEEYHAEILIEKCGAVPPYYEQSFTTNEINNLLERWKPHHENWKKMLDSKLQEFYERKSSSDNEETPAQNGNNNEKDKKIKEQKELFDLIHKNKLGQDPRKINLCGVDLQNLRLLDKEQLAKANLAYSNLYGVNLYGVNLNDTNLTRAILWNANLAEARLNNARLTGVDLDNANLSRAQLSGANLAGAIYLKKANFTKANLTEANLSQIKSGLDCNFTQAQLDKATITGSRLENSNFTQAELSETDFSNSSLENSNFTLANMNDVIFTGTNLIDTNFTQATLDAVNLEQAVLRNADFTGARISRSNFTKANLKGANFTKADLSEQDSSQQKKMSSENNTLLESVNLTDANLERANLTSTNLVGVIVSNTHFFEANFNNSKFSPALDAVPNPLSLVPTFQQRSELFNNVDYYSNKLHAVSPVLISLRDELRKNGLYEAERVATNLIQTRIEEGDIDKGGLYKLRAWVNRVVFNWTTAYGLYPERALILIFWIIIFFTLIYWYALRLDPKHNQFEVLWESKTYTKSQRRGIKIGKQGIDICYPLRFRPKKTGFLPWLKFEFRVLLISLYFSVLTTFQIGWRQYNIGGWIKQVQKRDIVLRVRKGWIRTASGFQSLLGLYLLVIWMLTQFGRPFE